jgi:hypothetical protein
MGDHEMASPGGELPSSGKLHSLRTVVLLPRTAIGLDVL